jgi:hypothetical protein
MGGSTQLRVSRLGAVACAIAVLALALVAPALMVHHAHRSFVQTDELRYRNPSGALNDVDANKRINQDARFPFSVEVITERQVSARAILAEKSNANLSVGPRLIRHKKIGSSPKGDPDLA